VDVILRFAWLFTVELAEGLQIYRRAMEHSSPICLKETTIKIGDRSSSPPVCELDKAISEKGTAHVRTTSKTTSPQIR
jgi:hypothetical protein